MKGCNLRGTTVERNCRHIVATNCWKQIGAVKLGSNLGARKQKVTTIAICNFRTRLGARGKMHTYTLHVKHVCADMV